MEVTIDNLTRPLWNGRFLISVVVKLYFQGIIRYNGALPHPYLKTGIYPLYLYSI